MTEILKISRHLQPQIIEVGEVLDVTISGRPEHNTLHQLNVMVDVCDKRVIEVLLGIGWIWTRPEEQITLCPGGRICPFELKLIFDDGSDYVQVFRNAKTDGRLEYSEDMDFHNLKLGFLVKLGEIERAYESDNSSSRTFMR